MGRLTELGWAIRDRMTATAVAVVLGLCALGAGVAGLVIALDAREKADDAAAANLLGGDVPATTAPAAAGSDPRLEATVDELNDRVAAIERSVSQLRSELGAGDSAEAP
jgi:hypothetical protein